MAERLTQQSNVGLGCFPPSRDSTDAVTDLSEGPVARQVAFPASTLSSPRVVWRNSFALATSVTPRKLLGSLRGLFAFQQTAWVVTQQSTKKRPLPRLGLR